MVGDLPVVVVVVVVETNAEEPVVEGVTPLIKPPAGTETGTAAAGTAAVGTAAGTVGRSTALTFVDVTVAVVVGGGGGTWFNDDDDDDDDDAKFRLDMGLPSLFCIVVVKPLPPRPTPDVRGMVRGS
jgi:hypothetical protein